MGELAHRRKERDLWISRGHLRAGLVAAVALAVGGFAFGYRAGRVPATPGRPSAFTAQIPDDALLEVLARVESSAAPQGGVQALTFPEALKGSAEPIAGVDDPPAGVDDPTAGVDDPTAGVDDPPAGADDPPAGVDNPPAGADDPTAGPPTAVLPSLQEVADPGADLALVQVPQLEGPLPLVDLPPTGSFTVVAAWPVTAEEATIVRDRLRADGLSAWVAAQLVDGHPQFQVNIGGYATRKAAEAAAPEIVARELEGAVVAFP